MCAARLEGGGRSSGAMRGRKANLSQRAQELRAAMALQEQGRKICVQSCEEKLGRNRERLARLREAVQEDTRALRDIQQRNKRTVSEICRGQKYLANKTVEEAQEKLRAEIYDRVNTCNMLLHQVRQRRQVREELQRRLRQLQDVARCDKRQRAQKQAIRQLEKNIEKMLLKVHAGQKVTALYLAVQDVLRKELAHLPPHLDLLCEMAELYRGELQDMDLMALQARKAADRTKEDAARMQSQFLAQGARTYRSLDTQKVRVDRRWREDAYQRQLRAQDRHKLTVESLTPDPQDPLVGTRQEAVKSHMEHEARVTEKMEKAKAAVQCSNLRDIRSRILAQQKSSVDLEQCVKECEEKKQALKERLQELELKQAQLKFHQPSHTSRVLEKELRLKLQCQEARLEQMRAQMLRNQDILLEFEHGIDSLFVRLQGITVPGQEDSAKGMGVEEKLRHCEQKLRYLVQRVANLPPDRRSPDNYNKVLAKVQRFLEKNTANDPQNLRDSLEDTGSSSQDPRDFDDESCDLVLTREDIKKQGLLLMKSKKRGNK